MKCIVTGGAGFVGTNLVNRLISDKHQVIILDNLSTGKKENLNKEAVFYNKDITHMRRESDFSIFKDVDVIFHMAALPRIKPSFENPKEVCDVNVVGTQNILEGAKKFNIPVIYAGSSSVHGGVYKNPYTFSKWQGEQLCEMYKKIYGLDITICRFYNVYGDYMINEGSYRTVLSIFLEQYENEHPLTITSDGEQRRDFTHIDDIVDAMIKCVEHKKYGYIFELGRGKNHSINEVVEMFGDIVGATYIDEIPGEARITLCDSKLAKEVLKWKPKINLNEWIKIKLRSLV